MRASSNGRQPVKNSYRFVAKAAATSAAAITLMVAMSKPQEKAIMVALLVRMIAEDAARTPSEG